MTSLRSGFIGGEGQAPVQDDSSTFVKTSSCLSEVTNGHTLSLQIGRQAPKNEYVVHKLFVFKEKQGTKPIKNSGTYMLLLTLVMQQTHPSYLCIHHLKSYSSCWLSFLIFTATLNWFSICLIFEACSTVLLYLTFGHACSTLNPFFAQYFQMGCGSMHRKSCSWNVSSSSKI